jgi:hypothetical protein
MLQEACRTQNIFKIQKRTSLAAKNGTKIVPIAERFHIIDQKLQRIYKFILPDNTTEDDFKASLSEYYPIEYFEKEHVYKTDAVPNDSLLAEQWALNKIDIFSAWGITQGADSVIVGVVDTGIDYTHPDLKNQIYYNPGEMGLDSLGRDKRFNGVDDDGDGFVDDYMGWDFTNRVGYPYDSTGGDYLDWDNNPMDEDKQFSHGTSIAGVIGAEANNKIGISGAAPKIKLLNCRAMDPDGNGSEEDVASAILYATMMGAKVINMSFGDNSFSYVLRDVIRYAYSKNVVLVASSGNDGSTAPHYPSGYSEVICVGNSTPEDYVASGSNYGSTLDLVAPGTSILTTARNNQYHSLDGTSLSAPFVSATAGLILSKKNFSNEEVKQIIKSTCDDIGTPGWDINSGAGRLNAGRALHVLAPSIIKFTYPFQDFATANDTINISGTVLSPYFKGFSLYYGNGLNPTNWIPLLENRLLQKENAPFASLNVSSVKSDTVITLRLLVEQSNGNSLEERINIHVIKNKLMPILVSLTPAMYGNNATVLAATYTDQAGLAKMYYREAGTTAFNFVSLDASSMNTSFVKNAHYGFIPLTIAKPNTTYEIYFEFENLVGAKSTLFDTLQQYFMVTSPTPVYAIPVTVLPYSLGAGAVFSSPLHITGPAANDVIFYNNGNTQTAYIYSMQNNSFILRDSLTQRIVKDFGDFTGTGKPALLTNWNRNLYFLEQQATNGTTFIEKYKREDMASWPVLAKDMDNDGRTEILLISNDSTLSLFRIKADYSLDSLSSIKNFGRGIFGKGNFNSPNAVLTDLDKNGKKQLWIADDAGNILCMSVQSGGKLTADTVRSFSVNLTGISAELTVGDFNGDGNPDLALLVHSTSQYQVAQYYAVIVVSFARGVPEVIYQKTFIDPSAEYTSLTNQPSSTIKFADLDNDGKQELIVCTFPYAYILRSTLNQKDDIIYYNDNVNANAVITGDFNGDGITEVGLPEKSGIKFFQFQQNSKVVQPVNLNGFSIDSLNIRLSWQGNAAQYYIYRSADSLNFDLRDSSSVNYYVDRQMHSGKYYDYKIGVKTSGNNWIYSTVSRIYSHQPAVVKSITIAPGTRSMRIDFSGNVETTISNLTNFHLIDSTGAQIYPASVATASQSAYQVSFNTNVRAGSYRFALAGMSDGYGSPIPADTFAVLFSDIAVMQEFYISSFTIENPYLISILFNLPVDTASISNPGNYLFNPSNQVKSVAIDAANPAKVYLHLQGIRPVGSTGVQHVLEISNVFSSVQSGRIPIKAGAGSVIQLSFYAMDLAGVYVYPNPVRPTVQPTMTFANLPKMAEIHVFSITGKHLKTLQTSDGTGGISWNLICEDGKQLSSGIYLYLVRQLNENNEEVRTKLEKFTVVR